MDNELREEVKGLIENELSDVPDRKEVKEIIHDTMEGPLARIEANIEVLCHDVKKIEKHLDIANGRTGKNEDCIKELEKKVSALETAPPHSVANCPQDGDLKELKKFMISQRAVSDSWYKTIGLISLIVGIIYSITFITSRYIEKKVEEKAKIRIEQLTNKK